MADTKISAEAAATSIDGTELVMVIQGGVNKRSSATLLASAPHTVAAITPITEAARDALTPAKGWLIYNSTTDKLQVCTNATGPVWTDLF